MLIKTDKLSYITVYSLLLLALCSSSSGVDVSSIAVADERLDNVKTIDLLPYDAQLRLAEAKALYRNIAVNDDAQAREHALQLLMPLAQKYPDNATIQAYLGSLWLLEAKHTWLIWRKYRLSTEGLRLLDKAVAQAPRDLEVRFIRGATTYHLPTAAQRHEQAAADLQWVTTRAAEALERSEFDATLAAAAFYYHGLCRAARADGLAAQSAWRTASRLAPASSSAHLAAQRLQRMMDTEANEK
jgi:ribosomal protein S7